MAETLGDDMVYVAFYREGKQIDKGCFKSENEARLKALALNWQYSVIATA